MGQIQARNCAIFSAILAIAGCAKDDAKYLHPVPPLSGEARAHLGPIRLGVASPANAPTVPSVPLVPEITVGQAAGGAALASLPVLALPAGCLGEPLCTVATGAVGVATYVLLVPVLTITALAGGPPDREEVAHATDSIERVIGTTDWNAVLRRDIEAEMRKGDTAFNVDASAASRLKLTLEGPFMVTDQFIALPTLTIHGELASDGDCVIDRRWRWNGDSDDFVDFGDNDAEPYRKAMKDGIEQLSNAIVAELFRATKPRKVAYWSEAAFKSGVEPRLVAVPMNYEDTVGSWDKTEAEAEMEPKCHGVM
jgi:hypothetical protein